MPAFRAASIKGFVPAFVKVGGSVGGLLLPPARLGLGACFALPNERPSRLRPALCARRRPRSWSPCCWLSPRGRPTVSVGPGPGAAASHPLPRALCRGRACLTHHDEMAAHPFCAPGTRTPFTPWTPQLRRRGAALPPGHPRRHRPHRWGSGVCGWGPRPSVCSAGMAPRWVHSAPRGPLPSGGRKGLGRAQSPSEACARPGCSPFHSCPPPPLPRNPQALATSLARWPAPPASWPPRTAAPPSVSACPGFRGVTFWEARGAGWP